MSLSRRVLVVQHEDDCPVGLIEVWLAREGLRCDVLEAHRGRALPAGLVDHEALVVLGGRMGAEDDEDHRWLIPTRGLIAGTVASGRPFLGVCLGHQLATVALGGRVRPNPRGGTRALLPFAATAEGRRDPLTSALAPGAPVLHWNDDVAVELPATAVPLATAPDGTVQAARFGPSAWGVQFHPEVDTDIVRRWARGTHPTAEASTLTALGSRRDELHSVWEGLIRRFGRIVAVA
jgi:GMP synthase (glutamine-hydrolysing)